MIRILGTVFAGLLGLAFGSFLNVCLSRWPQGESIVSPRSHCRSCARTLAWWENVPLVSWLALRGRCRSCGAWISWRYPLVELAVGGLWAYSAWRLFTGFLDTRLPLLFTYYSMAVLLGALVFEWLLVALAAIDLENLWLPDKLTLPGILGGIFVAAIYRYFFEATNIRPVTLANFLLSPSMQNFWLYRFLSIILAAAFILLIRWVYWHIRHREGMGLGDAKLMAMLAAWLGFQGALLSFGIGVVLAALVGVVVLIRGRGDWENTATTKLPLGTFLCIGGMVSALWGDQIINAYLRWSGL